MARNYKMGKRIDDTGHTDLAERQQQCPNEAIPKWQVTKLYKVNQISEGKSKSAVAG